MIDIEILIIGGGPGGASTAWKLRELGHEVLILDKDDFPRTKLCAGWVTPGVFKSLEMTPDEYPEGLVTFDQIHGEYFSPGKAKPLAFATTQYSIRRFEFDAWLLQRSGAPVQKHTVKEIRREGHSFIVDDTYRSKILIGAGGTHCPVARLLFPATNARTAPYQVGALEQEFPYQWKDERCMLWFGENGLPGYSWYVPKAGGYLNVGIGGFSEHMRNCRITLRQHWDHLTQKLQESGMVENHDWKPKGHTYFVRQRAKVTEDRNAYIVGDAAGLATCDLAEGIGPAIESGILTAHAIHEGRPVDLSGITRYSALERGWKASLFASTLDRNGTFFRDRIYARKYQKKEDAFLAAATASQKLNKEKAGASIG